jgi:hypothetical protein
MKPWVPFALAVILLALVVLSIPRPRGRAIPLYYPESANLARSGR